MSYKVMTIFSIIFLNCSNNSENGCIFQHNGRRKYLNSHTILKKFYKRIYKKNVFTYLKFNLKSTKTSKNAFNKNSFQLNALDTTILKRNIKHRKLNTTLKTIFIIKNTILFNSKGWILYISYSNIMKLGINTRKFSHSNFEIFLTHIRLTWLACVYHYELSKKVFPFL